MTRYFPVGWGSLEQPAAQELPQVAFHHRPRGPCRRAKRVGQTRSSSSSRSRRGAHERPDTFPMFHRQGVLGSGHSDVGSDGNT